MCYGKVFKSHYFGFETLLYCAQVSFFTFWNVELSWLAGQGTHMTAQRLACQMTAQRFAGHMTIDHWIVLLLYPLLFSNYKKSNKKQF